MDMKKSILLISFLIITTYLSALSADEVKMEIATYETKKGQKITAEITLHSYSSSNPLKYNFVWGSDPAFGPPENIITDITILLAGKKIRVPLSSYCDLTNYKKSWMETEKNQTVLNIKGGQTSESYHAKIYFDNFVRKRIVRHQIFPDNAWEETIYKINELDI
jgi:hypothetical protein